MNKDLKRKRKAYFKRACKKAELKATRSMVNQFLSMFTEGDLDTVQERYTRKIAAIAIIGHEV